MGKRACTHSLEKAFIGALVAALIMKLFLFDFMIAEGQSMMPAIRPGHVLLVFKLYYGVRLPGSGNYLIRWTSPKAGDVVVFITPLGEIAVKRCGEILSSSSFFALGDNGPQSYDSRSYGPVPMDNVVGKVLGVR